MKKNLDITNGIFFSKSSFRINKLGFYKKSHIKLFRKLLCKHGKKILHFMIKSFQIKKLQIKYLLINLKTLDFSYHTKN